MQMHANPQLCLLFTQCHVTLIHSFLIQMNLLSVRVVDSNPLPINRPTIGPQGTTEITIESNDDANGIWSIYSNSPNAVSDSSVRVQEREGLSVSEELVIERRGEWRVSLTPFFCCLREGLKNLTYFFIFFGSKKLVEEMRGYDE